MICAGHVATVRTVPLAICPRAIGWILRIPAGVITWIGPVITSVLAKQEGAAKRRIPSLLAILGALRPLITSPI
jgi:hypothetical protein